MTQNKSVKAVVIEPDEGLNSFLCDFLDSLGYRAAGGVPCEAAALLEANADCRVVVTSVYTEELRHVAASARVIMLYAHLTDAKRDAARQLGGRLVPKRDIAWALMPAIAPAAELEP